jgi:riboflavin biosynthesis pyrimidine reductase
VRQIYPVQGPDLQVVPKAAPGPLPAAVEELARLYRHGAELGNQPADADAADTSAAQPPAWLQANMVASADGAASLDGRSGGLSGPADRMVFTVLRSLADVILVGAGTARTERYRPAQAAELWQQLRPADAPQPVIAVVSATLNIDPGGRLLTGAAAGAETIVVTTTGAPSDRKAAIARHARVIEAGDDAVDLTAAVTALRSLGYARILCEGGPTLLGQLAAEGLMDELCLTTSPLLAAGRAGRILAPSPTGTPAAAATDLPARLSLGHLLADENFLFSRYLTVQSLPDFQPTPDYSAVT